MKKTIYISLPITGRSLAEVQKEAQRIKEALEERGYATLSPLDVYAGTHPTYEDYMAYDIRALLMCDGVCFAHDWHQSKGCRLEHSAAEIYQKQILTQTKEGDIL